MSDEAVEVMAEEVKDESIKLPLRSREEAEDLNVSLEPKKTRWSEMILHDTEMYKRHVSISCNLNLSFVITRK